MIEGRNARPAAQQIGDGPGRIGAALEVDVLARQEVRRWPPIGDSKALGPHRYCLAANEDDRAVSRNWREESKNACDFAVAERRLGRRHG